MVVPPEQIRENLKRVRGKMAEAAMRAGRNPDSIRLIVVTKSVGIEEIQTLLELGIQECGESRLEEAREKVRTFQNARWHMVGTVQRRKAREVVELFDYVDSVDRMEVAEALEKWCQPLQKRLRILVEVNVSGEPTKHGFSLEELPAALERLNRLEHLMNEGLMTLAPWVDNPETVRPIFATLREYRDRFGLKELSMGMSNDFEVAIEEGATQVRIGTALFQ